MAAARNEGVWPQRSFRRHFVVDEWLQQFTTMDKPRQRYTSLLLRGASKAGKTSMAKSLFEEGTALVLNCEGCSPDLPSLRAFDPERHSAIIWDEIDEQQVLANKLVFQAGTQMITLGQSKCNQYSHGVYLHGIAMILLEHVPHAAPVATDHSDGDRGGVAGQKHCGGRIADWRDVVRGA